MVEVRSHHPVAAVVVDAVGLEVDLLEHQRRALDLVVQPAPGVVVVRVPLVDVQQPVVVEVEDHLGHLPLVPVAAGLLDIEPDRLVVLAGEGHVALAVVEQHLAAVGVFAGPPVADLAGHQVHIAVVVQVGACGGAAVAPQPEGLTVLGVGPVLLGAADQRRCHPGAAVGRGVGLAVAAGELVVAPILLVVIGVARGHRTVGVGHLAAALLGLPEVVGRAAVGWDHQLGQTVVVEVAGQGAPGPGVAPAPVEVGDLAPGQGGQPRAGGDLGEPALAVAGVEPVLMRDGGDGGPRAVVGHPDVQLAVLIVVHEGAAGRVLGRPHVTQRVGRRGVAEDPLAVVDHQLAHAASGGLDAGVGVQVAVVVHVAEADRVDLARHGARARGVQPGRGGDVLEAALARVAQHPALAGVTRGYVGPAVAVDVGHRQARGADPVELPALALREGLGALAPGLVVAAGRRVRRRVGDLAVSAAIRWRCGVIAATHQERRDGQDDQPFAAHEINPQASASLRSSRRSRSTTPSTPQISSICW